jgi:biopolymer transport protein ExbB/TolQ
MEPAPLSPKPSLPRPNPIPGAPEPTARRPLPGKSLLGRRDRTIGQVKPGGVAEAGKGPERPVLVSLSWAEEDIENRWGIFKGGRYTSVNRMLAFLLAAPCTAIFLVLMYFMYHHGHGAVVVRIGRAFTRTTNLFATLPATLCFFMGVVIVCLKISKLRLQRRALELAAVPQHQDFILNETTARTVLERMRSLVDDTKNFILLNRIDRALSNLHNIGGVSDVSTILKSQADNDENQVASSYALINAMIWAIPVLGFVGTVLGLTMAMSDFNTNGDPTQIKESLGPVVAGLSTAFETTLVGLVFALVLHLFSDLVQERETDFLDECNDYCHAHVVSKLRMRRDPRETS